MTHPQHYVSIIEPKAAAPEAKVPTLGEREIAEFARECREIGRAQFRRRELQRLAEQGALKVYEFPALKGVS